MPWQACSDPCTYGRSVHNIPLLGMLKKQLSFLDPSGEKRRIAEASRHKNGRWVGKLKIWSQEIVMTPGLEAMAEKPLPAGSWVLPGSLPAVLYHCSKARGSICILQSSPASVTKPWRSAHAIHTQFTPQVTPGWRVEGEAPFVEHWPTGPGAPLEALGCPTGSCLSNSTH